MGYANVNLRYYGTGSDWLSKNPFEFTIKLYVLLQQATFRLGKSHFMLGGKYVLALTNVTVLKDNEWLDPKDFKLTNSGLGIIGLFDNLNTFFSPTKGWRIHLSYDQYAEILGSDRNFGTFGFYTLWYQPVNRFWFSGFRAASKVSTGDPPFFMLPFIELRGIPVMRYQGEITALAETEQLFMVTKRWGVLGFGGYGRTFYYSNSREKGANVWNAGVGFRYLIARLFGLKMGIDIARGPEEWAFYIVVGSAWLR
jgi:hypothetical protein